MLIIFDCDGVLRSVSWEAIHEAYQAIENYISKGPNDFMGDIGKFKAWFDSDWQYNLERMGLPRGSDTSAVNKIFHDIYDSQIQVFPWVKGIMEELSGKHRLAVLSASSVASIRKSLDGSSGYFSSIIGYEQVKNVKPDPEGINLIMKQTGAAPAETIMVGDTQVDIWAGKSAGAITVGVTWGMTESVWEMENLCPDIIIERPEDLLTL